jgi:hypothetical protein
VCDYCREGVTYWLKTNEIVEIMLPYIASSKREALTIASE